MARRTDMNKNYKSFIEGGFIELITPTHLKQALENVKGNHVKEGRALLILLYLTGARPAEILNVRSKDIKKEGRHVKIFMQTLKRGLARTVFIPVKNEFIKEVVDFAESYPNDMLIFFNYRSIRARKVLVKSKKHPEGRIIIYNTITDKLNYHVKKWFTGVIEGSIPPYYLRHNRFSQLAMKDVRLDDLKYLKGSKTVASLEPYTHLSSRAAKRVGNKID